MTHEEAKKYFGHRLNCGQCGENTTQQKAFEVALDCINKQIPKKPKEENGNVKVFCPTCKRSLSGHEYCGRCGQKINWSEV